MPELPEVETVRAGLAARLEGRIILRAEQFRPDLRFALPTNLSALLERRTVHAVRRRAKYLLFDVGDATLIGHLGMSGKYVVRPQHSIPLQKHEHLRWQLDDGHEVIYHDPRRFGFLLLAPASGWQSHPMLAALGVEPFDTAFTPAYLAEKLKHRQAPIKQFLLDQSVIAGIGNIYASEILFRCGIRPDRPAASCVTHAEALVAMTKCVLAEAIASGGSTLRNYATASGDKGYFQHQFAVYGRQGQACTHCATGVIVRLTQAGRTSFFCPVCQD